MQSRSSGQVMFSFPFFFSWIAWGGHVLFFRRGKKARAQDTGELSPHENCALSSFSPEICPGVFASFLEMEMETKEKALKYLYVLHLLEGNANIHLFLTFGFILIKKKSNRYSSAVYILYGTDEKLVCIAIQALQQTPHCSCIIDLMPEMTETLVTAEIVDV